MITCIKNVLDQMEFADYESVFRIVITYWDSEHQIWPHEELHKSTRTW